MKGAFYACQQLMKAGMNWIFPLEGCTLAMDTIVGNPLKPRFNIYDIREKCVNPPLCYDFSLVGKFLARPDVI